MTIRHPKLDYLESNRLEFERKVELVQSELKAVTDVTIKAEYENRLNLLFQKIEQLDREIETLQHGFQQQETQREVNRLIEILEADNEQWENLQKAYQKTVLHWTSRVRRDVENASAIVCELNKILPGKSSYTALEEFIAHLIVDISDPLLVNTLKQWGVQYHPQMDWLDLHGKIQESQCKRLENAQPAILLAISRSDEASTQAQEDEPYYQLNAWLIEDIETYQTKKTGYYSLVLAGTPDAEPCLLESMLEKMPRLLNDCLSKQSEHCEKCVNYPQIHVFLPVELLHLGVDVWQPEPETGGCPTCLGHDYVVVIQCAARYRSSYRKRPSWLKLWKRYQSLLKEAAKNVLIPGHDDDLDALREILDEVVNSEEEDSKIVGLHITQAPADIQQLCWKLLDSGLPIAIWVRKNLVNQDHETQLLDLLEACCLEQLPDRVKKKRSDACKSKNSPDCHIGHHLSLLWDDPSLVPPKSA